MSDHSHPRQQYDLIGHDEAQAQIMQAMAGGRMPHAWLFTGAEGIGKATLAFRFARFLLSGRVLAADLHVPPENAAAHLVAAGSHPDLLHIERQYDEKKGRMLKNIAVDDVRRIAPFLGLTASQGKWRIAIVDGADCLSVQAQNALLKTLEEPPENSVLILTAENASTLLPTIRSRCRVLKMPSLSAHHVQLLATRHGVESDYFLIEVSGGSAAKLFRYSACDARAMYCGWLAFLAAPHNRMARLHLAEQWSLRDSDETYQMAQDILAFWMQRVLRAMATRAALSALVQEETALLKALYPQLRLEKMLPLWDTLQQYANDAYHSNLDRKTVLLKMFDKTAEAIAA